MPGWTSHWSDLLLFPLCPELLGCEIKKKGQKVGQKSKCLSLMQQPQAKSRFQKCGFQYQAYSWGTGKCSTSTTRRQLAAWVIFTCDCWMWQIENSKEYEFMLWEWSNPASAHWLKPTDRCGVLRERNAIEVLRKNGFRTHVIFFLCSFLFHHKLFLSSLYGRWKVREEPLKHTCKAWIAINLFPFLLWLEHFGNSDGDAPGLADGQGIAAVSVLLYWTGWNSSVNSS